MALAVGTPMMHTFSEFHSPKCWMFKDIGLEEWAPAEKILEILIGIHKDYAGAEAKVKKAMAYVEERAAACMSSVKKTVNA